MEPLIDFSKIDSLPEGLDPTVLNSEAVQAAIKTGFDKHYETRYATDVSGLKGNSEALKAEKQRIQEKFDEFKTQYKDVDLDAYNQALEFKRSNGDASKLLDNASQEIQVLKAELQGKDDVYNEKLSEREQLINERDGKIRSMLLTNNVKEGISEHNARFPAVALKPAQEKWIAGEAEKVWRYSEESGSFVAMNGDRVITGPSGEAISYGEWINTLRDKAEFQEMFHQPTGGGAGGGGAGGAAYNPKNLAGNADERRSAIGGMFPDLPAR